MSEIWEPWTPVVGQRVRFRLTGECRADHPFCDGGTGTVVGIDWTVADGPEELSGDPDIDAYRGHWYVTDLDVPSPCAGENHLIRSDSFAAAELEPLPEEDPNRRAVRYIWTFDGRARWMR